MIDKRSLSRTIDAVYAQKLSAAERKTVARWIAARQGLPGAYGDTFAGLTDDTTSIVVFTGERMTSASARHILGEEACRALRVLDVRDTEVTGAIARAEEGLMRCLARAAEEPKANPGRFCCGKCTVALWRNLLAGGLDRREERLRKGVAALQTYRAGDGTWRVFPFWYTVLALAEMDFAEAKKERAYARPMLERAAERAPGKTVYAQRHHALAKRVLEL